MAAFIKHLLNSEIDEWCLRQLYGEAEKVRDKSMQLATSTAFINTTEKTEIRGVPRDLNILAVWVKNGLGKVPDLK